VIGSVLGSMNATVGGQSLLPNTTIFSGDSVQVKDGVAVVAVGTNSRVIFGRDTVASFLRDTSTVTVLLSQGNVSLFHPTDGTPVRVKAGPVSITPTAGFKTLGEVAMLNDSIVVTAKEGALQVEGSGASKSVSKGQTIVISPKTAKGGGGGGAWGGAGMGLQVASLGASGLGAILAGVAISRADNATTAANQATSAANAATSAASAAGSSAVSASSAAQSAASAAGSSAISASSAAGSSAVSAANAANSSAKLAQFLAACANDYLQQGNTISANNIAASFGIAATNCPTYGVNVGTGAIP